MFEGSSMMGTNYILEKSLDVESLRKKVIADNVANVDVPHFKRSEVNFESELKRALDNNKYTNENRVPALITDNRHIPFFVERDIKSVQPRINLDYSTSMRNDGNNVDIEKEMVDAAKNKMRYDALVAALNHNFKMIKLATRTA
ncbi:MAG TPA: flagellar basal body rod protein FlgB [Spirochaetota bacterium]|jgi:flagellar basal-body rod protein FlgB|nr:flagellar basal body rod protein FlgB [Spirochaetota bacterium]OQA96700.1 MAG: Flagellar basal body rod protein FlgB [Spirochaetes bacterium ADurb.Bin218]HOK00910.1 flagellar basal body rod protein FlgB [Spirochaetota bacterium]HOK91246.1 flagellar basal body rod protein FlgB [Spirochaetota bacterium]HON16429.1 flagellar basal body rod protein FlgB [Spirochaetota bacterium]